MAKKKTLKTYITSTGAQQYGSLADAKKHLNILEKKFSENPSAKILEILKRMDAAVQAAEAKRLRDEGWKGSRMFIKFHNDMEKLSKSAAESEQLKKLKKKEKSLLKR